MQKKTIVDNILFVIFNVILCRQLSLNVLLIYVLVDCKIRETLEAKRVITSEYKFSV